MNITRLQQPTLGRDHAISKASREETVRGVGNRPGEGGVGSSSEVGEQEGSMLSLLQRQGTEKNQFTWLHGGLWWFRRSSTGGEVGNKKVQEQVPR